MSGTASLRRPWNRRRSAGPILPEDLVVWEILVRLPAKPLLRCRAVCRSWRRGTSDPGFLLAHHRRQPSLPLVSFHGQLPAGSDRSGDSHVIAVDTLDLQRSPSPSERQSVLRVNDYNHYFFIHGSCDGLLLLALSDREFHLCNPAPRQSTELPRLVGSTGAALYPHASSGEYRVIFWNGRHSPDRKFIYHVITLGSSSEPRRVEASTPCAKRLVENEWFCLSLVGRPGVLLHGCLHWLPHGSKEKVLVVFDTEAESFRSMASPVAAGWDMPQLLELDGTLAVSWTDKSKTMMKLWALQDYETGIWTLQRRVILPMVEMRSIVRVSCWFSGTVVSEDGDVLLHSHCRSHLFHSDSKGELVHKFCWNREFLRPAGHWFRESLVRYEFFGRQHGTRASARRQPRFFREL